MLHLSFKLFERECSYCGLGLVMLESRDSGQMRLEQYYINNANANL